MLRGTINRMLNKLYFAMNTISIVYLIFRKHFSIYFKKNKKFQYTKHRNFNLLYSALF